jgi:putative PEP-CTERM system TPR-repeat lipoprotein
MQFNYNVVGFWWALIGSSLLLTGCDRFRGADTIVQRGETQFQNGNFRAAMGDFRTALERDAEHVPARIGLARTLLLLGDFEGALDTLDMAVKRGAQTPEVVNLRFEILLALGRNDAVVAEAPAEARLTPLDRSLFMARALAGQQDVAQAEVALAQVLSIEPRNARGLITKALLAAEGGRLAEAGQILDGVLAANEEDSMAWFAKGRVTLASGDVPAAKAALEKASDLGKRTLNWREQAQLFALLTEVALLNRSVEEADRWLASMDARVPQSALGHHLRARVALLNGNMDEAVAQLQRALNFGDFLPSQLLLAGIQMAKSNYGQAESQLNKIMTQHPGNPEARKLLAQVFLATNRPADANRVLPTNDASIADPQVDWLRGQSLFVSGSKEAGLELLEKSVAANKEDTPNVLQLARVYLMSGQRDKAIKLLESMPANRGGAQRQGLLVLASVSGKNRDDAKKEIDALLARNPQDSMLHAASGALLVRLGDNPRATTILQKAVALDASNSDARMTLAGVYFTARQFDQTEEQLRAVAKIDTKNSVAYTGLASVALARGNKPEAIKQLELAMGADADAVEPRLQLARLALADRDYQRAGNLLDQAVAVGKNSPAVLNAAGAMLYQAQQYDDALARFERGASRGDAQSNFNVAQVQLALGRKPEARRRLAALAESGDRKMEVQAASALVRMDVEEGKLDIALSRIKELGKRSDIGDVADELEGDVYVAQKHWPQAAASFERAFKKQPSQRVAVKRFQSAFAAGQANAVDALTAWVQQAPADFAVRKLLGKYFVQRGQNERAIAEYESWLKDSRMRDADMLNDLAWLYGEKGDSRGVQLAEEAYAIRPAVPEIADTYGWLLLGQNQVTKALPILEIAAQGAQNNPEIQYHYAAAQMRAGDLPRAQALLQATLDKYERFPSRDAAARLLQSSRQQDAKP